MSNPSRRLFNISGKSAVPLALIGDSVFGHLNQGEANAVSSTVPLITEQEREREQNELIAKLKDGEYISEEDLHAEKYIGLDLTKHIFAKSVHIYNNSTMMADLRKFSETGGEFDLDQILQIYIKRGNSPFNKNFVENFPFHLKLNEERYVLSLYPLKTINNPADGTSVVLEYVKTLRVYVKDNKVEFIDFIKEDPSSVSHFKKKKASSKKKKASQKKKKASPKKKKASPKAKKASSKKKASTKKKNHGGLS